MPSGWQWFIPGADGGANYLLSRWIFLRFLGLICLIAFVSFWVQCSGLIGSSGILPARRFLRAIALYIGPNAFGKVPTVFWLNSSDAALGIVCALGACFSVLLMAGIAPIVDLVFIWGLYLSLTQVGQDFLSFQWDVLLLETCFLAVFLAPTGLWPKLAAERVVAPVGLFLMWWLLFRLMFESGIVKLTSGDLTWRNLTALNYHYFTQPLPTALGWYVNALPGWFQKASVIFVYVIEIGFPFLFFLPAPWRYAGCAGTILLMLLIALTGNYTFFNLLTIALALLLIDDRVWNRILPGKALAWLHYSSSGHAGIPWVWAVVGAVVAGFFLVVGTAQVLHACAPRNRALVRAERRLDVLEPIHTLNSYGLFRVMTTTRAEIAVEGSLDGERWVEYEFKYKPGDVRRRPPYVAPHQPRLDWQMWFAALEDYDNVPWFQAFLIRLLEAKPEVLGLLAKNPFPDQPPRYVRAMLYEYRFTSPAERKATGAWWKRELLGAYSPVLGLRQKSDGPPTL